MWGVGTSQAPGMEHLGLPQEMEIDALALSMDRRMSGVQMARQLSAMSGAE